MRNSLRNLLGVFAALFTAWALTACPGPKSIPAPTANPPIAAPTAISDDWTQHESGQMRIRLPNDWQVLKLSQGDLQTVFAEFQTKNPELAKIIGSADALQGVTLWAFRSVPADAAFVDNLNIRRSPLNGQKIEKMADVVSAVEAQYKQLGFEVKTSRANLTIGGKPAALIIYGFPLVNAEGKTTTIMGHQYLIASATDLWILSFSAAPENEAALAPVFEQIGLTFSVK